MQPVAAIHTGYANSPFALFKGFNGVQPHPGQLQDAGFLTPEVFGGLRGRIVADPATKVIQPDAPSPIFADQTADILCRRPPIIDPVWEEQGDR